ncbi:hypothetical protein Syun_007822 [Stephania yunnanensis]|uniref:Uncharacterized protein n=1 Tax=Stephania yunnanensis TaxID=152371 RepID=A0AAP0KZA1_9MAGN
MSPLQHPPPHRNPQIPRRPNPSSSPTTEIPKSHGDAQIPSSSLLYTRLSELREPPPPSIVASPHRQPSPFLESSRTLAIATCIHRLHTRASNAGRSGSAAPQEIHPPRTPPVGARSPESTFLDSRYHNRLLHRGNCRMCLVEVEKSPKPVLTRMSLVVVVGGVQSLDRVEEEVNVLVNVATKYVEFKYDIKAINMIIAAVAIESLPESDDEDVQR